jgi:DEAD/DEAH box helicase domain-containing protein
LGEHSGAYTEVVEPVGFAVDLLSTPTRVVSEKPKPQYIEPLLINLRPWTNEQRAMIDMRIHADGEDAKILFFNKGTGAGYSLCLDCGRMATSNELLQGHKRLRGGKNVDGDRQCTAANVHDHIVLGASFKTDFTELRFLNADGSFLNEKSLAYSLGVIITKSLAEFIGIEEGELGFGVKQYRGYQTVFIYDTAKGGAGYASQLPIHLKDILEKSLQILSNCDCNIACTKCLIDRKSQWHIEELDRKIAIDWLKNALAFQIPPDLNYPGASAVLSTIKNELRSLHCHHGIKTMNIFVHHAVTDWDIENLEWIEELRRKGIDVNIVILQNIECETTEDILTLHKLSSILHFKKAENSKVEIYNPHFEVELDNNQCYCFLSKLDLPDLNASILSARDVVYYKVAVTSMRQTRNHPIPEIKFELFETRISTLPRNCNSGELAEQVLNNLSNRTEFIKRVSGKKFTASYFDKYNQSEFSMRILLQFTERLCELLSFEVTGLKIHLSHADFVNKYRVPQYIIHNLRSVSDYEVLLNQLTQDSSINAQVVIEERLPHYRYFSFQSPDLNFHLRIDAGIAHGLKPDRYLRQNDLPLENIAFSIKKDVPYDLIYSISIE